MEAYSKSKTDDEMRYINNIGKFHWETKTVPRKVMLEKYYYALLKREDWGNLDKQEILGYVTKQIAKY